jgi:hypothetical protein
MTTSGHISDQLPGLLTGESARTVVLGAAEHLRGCADCQQELVSAVVAHAALTSGQRFAPEILAAVRDGVLADPDASAQPLPDLSEVFAEVRAEAAAGERPAAGGRPGFPRRRAALVGAAVVVGAAVGVGATVAVEQLSSSSPSTRTVALGAYDAGTVPATARITASGRMELDASKLPQPGPSRRYEVWLTNSARTVMQPVGWIGGNGTAALTVPAELMRRFQDIEVSVQDINASKYLYSGTSVLRGSYR